MANNTKTPSTAELLKFYKDQQKKASEKRDKRRVRAKGRAEYRKSCKELMWYLRNTPKPAAAKLKELIQAGIDTDPRKPENQTQA